jgi:hypothetical protein
MRASTGASTVSRTYRIGSVLAFSDPLDYALLDGLIRPPR